MKSIRRFNKKWKWGLIGTGFSSVIVVGMSLGIALAAENKSLDVSSPYFIGQNTREKYFSNLHNIDPNFQYATINNNVPNTGSWSSIFNNNKYKQFKHLENNLSNYDNANLSDKNLLNDVQDNLSHLLNGQNMPIKYYTLNDASFFNSNTTLFTNATFNTIKNASKNLINITMVPRSPTTLNQVYNNCNGELVSVFWSPDYNDVSAWIGYLFADNNSWCTANLWACLWAYLAGANPTNGTFVFNNEPLKGSMLSSSDAYSNYPTFSQQLYWTNQRRLQMGLGDLPGWAASLYQYLYNTFPSLVAWNTPYGWWPVEYNENNSAGLMQYALERWTKSAESAAFWYKQQNANDLNMSYTPVTYSSQSSLIQFIQWIDSLVPVLPFYSSGNNTTNVPVLTQKGVYLVVNPGNNGINSQYFMNLDKTKYNSSNKFVFFLAESVLSDSNMGYFSPVIGSQGFYNFAPGLYSGLINYAPYDYEGNGQYSYNPVQNVSALQTKLKLVDANNLILAVPKSNFKAAHYNSNGTLNSGSTLSFSGPNQNAIILFDANPFNVLYEDEKSGYGDVQGLKENKSSSLPNLLTEAQFNKYCNPQSADPLVKSWSSYADYISFMKYRDLATSDPNLTYAESHADIYQYGINDKIDWVNTNGQSVWQNSKGEKISHPLVPEDFLNPLTWTAASYSSYSYNASATPLAPIQGNSYMLQELGLAGNNFNLGAGSGFFQTEAYAPNQQTTDSANPTFTYFLSPNNINQKNANTLGWMSTASVYNPAATSVAVPYFLSMLASEGAYFDPIPSFAPAFTGKSLSSHYGDLTVGQLNQEFLGNSSTNGVWNISQEMTNLINSNTSGNVANTKQFKALFKQLNKLPVYQALVADETVNGYNPLYSLYGSGLNQSGSASMQNSNNQLYFNGGYYAISNSFTNASLETTINPNFFNNVNGWNITVANGVPTINQEEPILPLFGTQQQKLGYVEYKWDANITSEEELILYKSNEISTDFSATATQIIGMHFQPNQMVYFNKINKSDNLDSVFYNAQIFNETTDSAGFLIPTNTLGNPLIKIGTNASVNSYDNNEYFAKYGYPLINTQGQVAYTDPNNTTAQLKSYATPAYENIVGTALNPFIYGTTGAEIRQDINALVNWQAIAADADMPLPQNILCNSLIPYGNFRTTEKTPFYYQNLFNQAPTISVNNSVQPYSVATFYQYAAAVPGMGLLGPSLYCTITNSDKNTNNAYYAEESTIYWNQMNQWFSNSSLKGTISNNLGSMNNGYTQYEWQFMDAVNGWDS